MVHPTGLLKFSDFRNFARLTTPYRTTQYRAVPVLMANGARRIAGLKLKAPAPVVAGARAELVSIGPDGVCLIRIAADRQRPLGPTPRLIGTLSLRWERGA